jgi:hypothetical protein
LQDAVSRRQRLDRYQHILHFALHVGGHSRAASREEPRYFPYRLARTLVGDAMHHDDGNAIGRAHRLVTVQLLGHSALILVCFFRRTVCPHRRRVKADALQFAVA